MAGQRMVQYSSLCGMMADCSFTRDAAFLDMPAHLSSITPTKFAPAATQLVADGVPNDGVGDSVAARHFRDGGQQRGDDECGIPRHDRRRRHDAAHRWWPGRGRCSGTDYMRQNRVRDFCSPHPDDPTLFCLKEFLMLHNFSPGMFLSAARDRPGYSYRVLMESSSVRAIASGDHGHPLLRPAQRGALPPGGHRRRRAACADRKGSSRRSPSSRCPPQPCRGSSNRSPTCAWAIMLPFREFNGMF